MKMRAQPNHRIGRRRMLRLFGAGAGMLLAPATALARGQRYVWRGEALGAVASITLFQEDSAAARRIVGACLAEVERLEKEFSLYRPDSALVRLNRTGLLERPSHDMRRILA
jgi:thiamine biosynthesis lipoprotein